MQTLVPNNQGKKPRYTSTTGVLTEKGSVVDQKGETTKRCITYNSL